jgi:methionyl-tRNA formyltransferase
MLEALLGAGFEVCAVLIGAEPIDAQPIRQLRPGPSASALPIANPFVTRTIMQLAWERDIPVFEVARPAAAETLALLAALRPDAACVACFPQRLPKPLLELPQLGFLNMHPALLPAHRGPAPLFWTIHGGERTAGVTIHFMDQQLDTGDIVMQREIVLPDGISGLETERRCAALGARLMVESLQALGNGALARRPQPPGGSYQPWPTPDDWRIDTSWSARRAFNFMRGTEEWGLAYLVSADGEELVLASAIAYDGETTLAKTYVREGDEVQVQFAMGVLRAKMRCAEG